MLQLTLTDPLMEVAFFPRVGVCFPFCVLSGCNIVLVDGVVFSLELAAYFPFSYRLCLVDGMRITLLAMCEGERGRVGALAPTPVPSALPQPIL